MQKKIKNTQNSKVDKKTKEKRWRKCQNAKMAFGESGGRRGN
jgi:hypothetical protein